MDDALARNDDNSLLSEIHSHAPYFQYKSGNLGLDDLRAHTELNQQSGEATDQSRPLDWEKRKAEYVVI